MSTRKLIFYAGLLYEDTDRRLIVAEDIPDGGYVYWVETKEWSLRDSFLLDVQEDDVPKELRTLKLLLT